MSVSVPALGILAAGPLSYDFRWNSAKMLRKRSNSKSCCRLHYLQHALSSVVGANVIQGGSSSESDIHSRVEEDMQRGRSLRRHAVNVPGKKLSEGLFFLATYGALSCAFIIFVQTFF